uniref:Reverse transcriptase domain-containing protein n=1 Tax=Leptobrachium leishanense TaxID=445787 RepID=A0A8C5MZ48_9ANUR
MEIEVLSRGLKFAPTRKHDGFKALIDVKKFVRNLTLKKFFCKNPIENSNPIITTYVHTDLKTRSTFFPQFCKSSSMDMFEKLVIKDLEKINNKKNSVYGNRNYNNMSKKEREALKILKEDKNTIIKPADKGGGIVLMTKTKYIEECVRQLSDNNTYKIMKKDPTSDMKITLMALLNEGRINNILNKKEYEYLSINHPKIPTFYILPKLHKNRENPPGRPIISGIGSISSRLSEYIDIFLQPVVKNTRSYLKDTKDILNILIQHQWQDDFWLVTGDVASLYTIIQHFKGLQATSKFLEMDGKIPLEQRDFLIASIKWILHNNYFWFNQDFYIQVAGTAMGTRFAPSYANLFMAFWEETFLDDFLGAGLVTYRRYIDDVIFIWKGDEASLQVFLAFLNRNDFNIHLDF